MKRIAVIDDRERARNNLKQVLDFALEDTGLTSEWEVLSKSPLPSIGDYPSWINEEEVGVLIIDQRLNEVPTNGLNLGYTGTDAVQVIRMVHKDIPIYSITAFPEADEIEENFGLYDEVIRREVFTTQPNPVKYLKRFIRKYENFVDENSQKLTELSELSKKIVEGVATDDDISRAKALQTGLEIPMTASALGARGEWLKNYEAQIEELERLKTEIAQILQRDSNEMV